LAEETLGGSLAKFQAPVSTLDRAKEIARRNDRATIIFSEFSEMIKRATNLNVEQKHWAETRWLFEAVWSFTNSLRCDRRHTITTFVATFSSLATPVAAGIGTTNTHWGTWARPITLVIGLVGATAVAVEKIAHNGPRWRLYRSSYEDLAAEGWAFFNGADGYAKLNGAERFQEFFDKVEKIIAARGQRYFVEIASLDESGTHKGS
jgi:hypothetical protein